MTEYRYTKTSGNADKSKDFSIRDSREEITSEFNNCLFGRHSTFQPRFQEGLTSTSNVDELKAEALQDRQMDGTSCPTRIKLSWVFNGACTIG